MNMKRPLAFLLAAGMTLGLAACGGNGGTSGSGSSGSSGSADGSAVTLDLWAFNIGGFTEASNWDTILAAFNEQHPDITVNVTPINYQDGDQKLTSAITSNSGPDIIFEGPERIVGNYAREGLMVDLSDLWTESAILLPPALGFSPHPPVSVYGTGTYKAIAAFLGTGLTCFATFISLRVTLSAHAADLPAAHLLRLHRYFHSRPMLSPCVPTVLFICGTGI